MALKAVLFDEDNTLFDTRGIARPCDERALQRFAKTPKERGEVWERFSRIVEGQKKNPDPSQRTRLFSYSVLARQLALPDEVAKRAAADFAAFFLAKVRPKAGAAELLKSLKRRGLALAVVTSDNEEWALDKLGAAGLDEYFDAVVTATDVGSMKPDEKYFLLACKKLGVESSDCAMVGDDEDADLAPARRAGMQAYLPDFEKLAALLG